MMDVSIQVLGQAHADAMLRLASDAELSWTSSVPAVCEAAHVAAWINENHAAVRTCLTFAIVDRGVVAGAVTLKRLDAPDNSGELAFWVGREHRGKGLARKAAGLALDHAFNRLLLDYVHAHCLRDGNPASRRTLEAIGFTADKSRSDLPVEGRFAGRFEGDAWVFYRLDRPIRSSWARRPSSTSGCGTATCRATAAAAPRASSSSRNSCARCCRARG